MKQTTALIVFLVFSLAFGFIGWHYQDQPRKAEYAIMLWLSAVMLCAVFSLFI